MVVSVATGAVHITTFAIMRVTRIMWARLMGKTRVVVVGKIFIGMTSALLYLLLVIFVEFKVI